MRSFFSGFYLTTRFFLAWAAVMLLFVLGYTSQGLIAVAVVVLVLVLLFTAADAWMVFGNQMQVKGSRGIGAVLSNGQETIITYTIHNLSPMRLQVQVLDELPDQLQLRSFTLNMQLKPAEQMVHKHPFRPVERGEYKFGNLYVFVSSLVGFVQRRIVITGPQVVGVYPSIAEMKKHEIKSFNRSTNEQGIKKLRRIGHSYEFEQIKNYVQGDDYRSVNWKATGRRSDLMVNQYEDEKAQSIYTVIDKSRVMKMPFGGLSLLDYAINTSLVLSNVALNRQDKAGLVTFSDKPNTILPADRGRLQLRKILDALYKEKERFVEANYELLYMALRNNIKSRSLLVFFTNFESSYALQRVLPLLRKINQKHLLVVVFFENTEVDSLAAPHPTPTMEEVYTQAIAQKYIYEKQQLVWELKQYGIYSVLTKPQDLTVNTVNKYLELKSRGLI